MYILLHQINDFSLREVFIGCWWDSESLVNDHSLESSLTLLLQYMTQIPMLWTYYGLSQLNESKYHHINQSSVISVRRWIRSKVNNVFYQDWGSHSQEGLNNMKSGIHCHFLSECHHKWFGKRDRWGALIKVPVRLQRSMKCLSTFFIFRSHKDLWVELFLIWEFN